MAAKKKKMDTPSAPKVFNLLKAGTGFVASARAALATTAASAKSLVLPPDKQASNRTVMLPIMDFGMQYLLHSRGLRGGVMLDIIGADGVGKTTLAFTMLGWFAQHNAPCLYVGSEAKPMAEDRILRALHPNRVLASRLRDTLHIYEGYEITSAVDLVESWAQSLRDPKNEQSYCPIQYPIVVVLDTFSKMMSPSEAVKYELYDAGPAILEARDGGKKKRRGAGKQDDEAAKKKMELASRSNMEHAKLAHRWSRRLPVLLSHLNCLLIVIRHQNDKVDMTAGAGGGSFVPAEVKETMNRTALGGRAFHQTAAYQLVMSSWKGEYATVAGNRMLVKQINTLKVAKNSYGPKGLSLNYAVVQVPRFDTTEMQEPALDFSVGLPRILEETNLMNVHVHSQNSVSVDELGLVEATPEELRAAIHQDPVRLEEYGRRLGFYGFATQGTSDWKIAEAHPDFMMGEQEAAHAENAGTEGA